MKRIALLAATASLAAGWSAFAADGVRVSLVGARPALTAGLTWTARLSVSPSSFAGVVRITAIGPKQIEVRARGAHGSYRARLLFPAAGRWTLSALAGGSTSRLGAVQVRKAAQVALRFEWPTSVDVEPGGALLLVENGLRRLVRISPSGRVTEIAAFAKPYAVRRAPSGSTFVTDGPNLLRIDGTNAPVRVASADVDIGPVTVAPNGDVWFATDKAIFVLGGGEGTPAQVAPTAQLSGPHGIAIARDGSVLVADTGNHRILRIDPATGAISTFASLGTPRGMDVAADGTVYVVDGAANRVVHLSATGAQLGLVGPVFDDPYAVRRTTGGAVYVVESLASGDVRRIAPDGAVTTVSRR